MKSIRVRLWAGMMVLVVIVILLLWLFQIVFLKSFYSGMRVAEVRKQGAALVDILNEGSGSLAEFGNRAERLAFDNNLGIEWIDLKGNEKFSLSSGSFAGSGQMMMRNNVRTEAISEALAGREVSVAMTHPRFGNKFALLGFPLQSAGKVNGALLITMPLAAVEETAAILEKQLIYISVVLLVAALILSYLLSRSFARPILEITRVSEKMASGDFTDRVKSMSQDEIGRLGATINTMGAELAKIEQLRKDLIANVSHELRTPLSLIRGYAETIRDVSGEVQANREKHLSIIVEESERLSRIVDDILDLSQWQAGYMKLDPIPYPLNASVESVIKRYELLSAKTGTVIRVEAAGAYWVYADRTRIEQVLYNLINNAFNYTNAGSIITVRAEDNRGKARVEVVDTGEGIEESEQARVWDRYYKGDNRSSRARVGTGLGLAIVKSILEAHRIEYGVRSQIGVGTTFWFELNLDDGVHPF